MKTNLDITIKKNSDLLFYHRSTFSNIDIVESDSQDIIRNYLRRLDDVLNPKGDFYSVLLVVVSTAFFKNQASFDFINFKGDKFNITVTVYTQS